MAKPTRLKKVEYQNLMKALSKAKFESPGIVARILLEAFLFENGDMSSEWFVREKACAKGSFTKLRNRLVKESWLYFREEVRRYFPGSRLKPHLEALREVKPATLAHIESLEQKKVDRAELHQQLEESNKKLEETNRRVEEIAKAVEDLQAAMLPPDSPAKKSIRERSALRIAELALVK